MKIELTPIPTTNEQETVMNKYDFTEMFAILQQRIFQLAKFDNIGFHFGFDGAIDRHALKQEVFNKMSKTVPIGTLINFLFEQLLTKVMEQEVIFLRAVGGVMRSLNESFDQEDLGYALSVMRSSNDLTDKEEERLIKENTSLSMDQYQEIVAKVGIAAIMSSGCDEESHKHDQSDKPSMEGFEEFLDKMIKDLSDDDADNLNFN